MVVLMETWLNDEDFKTAEERGDVFSTKKPDEDVLGTHENWQDAALDFNEK